ncbi:MAG: hypothetical protein Tp182DCM212571_3 [Prokaryotic dsDNA virus sp.]|jgi:hypothetical protein|nr:MAG: hypothetical protein Tp182DCM212571_3 [Prokaryotic dsDNA virus sp.]|tara:strand:- start:1232 stop:1636 length:405 start_codon:yes stop_codon:yes gene_type:complete
MHKNNQLRQEIKDLKETIAIMEPALEEKDTHVKKAQEAARKNETTLEALARHFGIYDNYVVTVTVEQGHWEDDLSRPFFNLYSVGYPRKWVQDEPKVTTRFDHARLAEDLKALEKSDARKAAKKRLTPKEKVNA